MPSCSERRPRRCAPSAPIRSISARRLALSPSSTLGARICAIMPGGGPSPDGTRWIACRPGFFLPLRVLSPEGLSSPRQGEGHDPRRWRVHPALSAPHGVCLLFKSSAWPEQLIEEVAEPRLEHVHLGLRDGDMLGPVIGDGPGREVMLRRLARKGPRIAEQRFKLLGCGRRAFLTKTGHCARIAERGR